MEAADIYHRIGQSIMDSIKGNWTEAKLEIEYIGSVGFHLNYFEKGNKKSCQLDDGFENSRLVKKLHSQMTQNEKNKWNRAIFTLKPEGDFDMEFIWDQELQDEVESFSE